MLCSQSEKVGGETVKRFINGVSGLEDVGWRESRDVRYCSAERTARIK